MIDIVDSRTGELLDTDSIPGLAQVAGLHAEQIRRLHAEVQAIQEPTSGATAPTAFAWKLLGAHQAETVWLQLSEWVGWLRGRYPLARQVPACWWRHPELVEELTALWLAWREAYLEKSAPLTAAADWHDRWLPGFLRRIGAGGWNLSCEGEHKERLASLYDGRRVDDPDGFAEHVRNDVDNRRGELSKVSPDEEETMTQINDDRMRKLLEEGTATTLGSLPGAPVTFDGAYWTPGEHGWTKIDDPETVEFMERAERRLGLANDAVNDRRSGGQGA